METGNICPLCGSTVCVHGQGELRTYLDVDVLLDPSFIYIPDYHFLCGALHGHTIFLFTHLKKDLDMHG